MWLSNFYLLYLNQKPSGIIQRSLLKIRHLASLLFLLLFWIVIQNCEILVQVHQHKLSLNDTKISGLIISIRNVYRFAYISIVILLRKFTANYCHNMCVAYQWVICMYRLVWWWITFFVRSSDHVVNVYASMVLKRTVYGNKILLCSVNCISFNAFTISIVFLSLEHACQNVLR